MLIRLTWLRARTWLKRRATIEYVRAFDDRLLSDLGIARDSIAATLTYGKPADAAQKHGETGLSPRPAGSATCAHAAKAPATCAAP